jgi:hypothetical protein
MLEALGGGGSRTGPLRFLPPVLGAGSVLSIQHPQKPWILPRNRHLADLEIDVLSSLVFTDGFSDHPGKGMQHQYPKDRALQVETAQVAQWVCFGEYAMT